MGRGRIELPTQGFSVPPEYGQVRRYAAFSDAADRFDRNEPYRSDARKGYARDAASLARARAGTWYRLGLGGARRGPAILSRRCMGCALLGVEIA